MFLLLPIGNEAESVRRQPWVSYGLIAINILVQLAIFAGFNERAALQAAGETHEEAVAFLEKHPYLEVPRDLTPFLETRLVAALAQSRADYQAQGKLPSEEAREREQKELDARVEQFLGVMSRFPTWRFGFIPAHPRLPNVITSMFVHSGWVHLIGNLFILLLSGPFLEDLFGRPLFAALYLCSGAAAAVAQFLANPESPIPMVGASGAIAGVMGAFLVRLSTSRIRFLFIPIWFVPALRFTFFLPAFVVLPLWFAQQVLYAGLDAKGVAWWAHIGGFLFGATAALVVRFIRLEEAVVNPGIEREITLLQDPGLEVALEARLGGDLETARQAIREVLAAQPTNPDALAEGYETALACGDRKEAGRMAVRLLEVHVRTGERELAQALIREAPGRVREPLPPKFYLAAAGFLEKEGDGRGALAIYETLASLHPQDPGALRALFRRGEILRRSGALPAAREAFERARAHPGCTGAVRQAVESALAELGGPALKPAEGPGRGKTPRPG